MGQTIEITKEIAAPPETVFRALTDPNELSRWWTSSADSDPRRGGAFDYRFEFEEQTEQRRDHSYSGTYRDVVENERVVYPWGSRLGETEVEVTLQPSGDGTKLRLVHRGWGDGGEWPAAVKMHEEGWAFFLGNLASYLERGEDQRAAAMGMTTPAATSSP
jgi:uncharacterized protein YndB with AHSA1/START domain